MHRYKSARTRWAKKSGATVMTTKIKTWLNWVTTKMKHETYCADYSRGGWLSPHIEKRHA